MGSGASRSTHWAAAVSAATSASPAASVRRRVVDGPSLIPNHVSKSLLAAANGMVVANCTSASSALGNKGEPGMSPNSLSRGKNPQLADGANRVAALEHNRLVAIRPQPPPPPPAHG